LTYADAGFDLPVCHDYKPRQLAAGFRRRCHLSASKYRPREIDQRTSMANTSSAKKATRVIARRTEINKSRRSRLRTTLGKVEEALASGDRNRAAAALKEAEPVLMRASQKGVLHPNAASRKVSRLTKRLAVLGK
jgi:small subunit ribosomal protein S20